jgi:L-lactate dehydrogenase (cytochrome)
MSRALHRCFSIADLRRLARRRLPRAAFDYLDGGADDEVTLAHNSTAFADWQLVPRVLRDISTVDLSTTLLGKRIALPILFSPTGMPRLFHHDGEFALARAAARAGTIFTLSTVGSLSIEDVAAVSDARKWFQIYVLRDRDIVRDFMRRCRAGGYEALCLTVDVPVAGRRERDLHNGLAIPPRISVRTALDALGRPRWLWHYLTMPRVTLEVLKNYSAEGADMGSVIEFINGQFDSAVTWDDAAWMIREWGGPFAIKGILSAADAVQAVELGASVIVVSNHGGRQLDHAPAPIEVLPEIVAAVAGRAEVILDGGIRRGTDVIKALALGARACMIGRPALFGLAAGGEAGVDHALDLLRSEIERDLKLLGCASVAALGPEYLRRRDGA